MMSEADERPVTTCSIGFADTGIDESAYAERVARLFGSDHHRRTVDPDDMIAVDELAGIFAEPFADPSALPTLRVCQLAREHVKVALSGDGADEALAGYRRQVFHHHEDRVRSVLPASLRGPVFGTLGRLWPKADWAPRPLRARSTFRSLARSGEEAYAASLCITPPDIRDRLTTPEFAALRGAYRAEDRVIDRMRAAPGRSALDRAQYLDMTFWLPGDILTKVDRTSMATGLEAREPLLDHRLVEFAATLPEAMRVRGRQGNGCSRARWPRGCRTTSCTVRSRGSTYRSRGGSGGRCANGRLRCRPAARSRGPAGSTRWRSTRSRAAT